MQTYPKRLIEVDLPIARISAHARREKSIRHGHISTLHIWWARRPLAACRAVICASLWPDPEDLTAWLNEKATDGSLGPEIRAPLGCKPSEGVLIRPRRFLDEAREQMLNWATRHAKKCSNESMARLVAVQRDPAVLDDPIELRHTLLDFIADFANWDNSTDPAFLETSRALTKAAHEALGGEPGTRPLVVDPFAGGGSIPLEALRVGADAFASDLNPVAILLNKVVLEYIPKYGQKLADEVRKWGQWVKEQADKELAEFYPRDPDGATPIAYFWARSVRCEGPSCGQRIPLLRSRWISRSRGRLAAVEIVSGQIGSDPSFRIVENPGKSFNTDGTVRRGSAVCMRCGYTTPVESVRRQLSEQHGGAATAALFCVAVTRPDSSVRTYRAPMPHDHVPAKQALERIRDWKSNGEFDTHVPNEPLPPDGALGYRIQKYGMHSWCDVYTPRQQIALATLAKLCRSVGRNCSSDVAPAVQLLLCYSLSRTQDLNCSTSTWANTIQAICGANRAQNRMPMVWDFVEAQPLGKTGGNWLGQVEWVAKVVEHVTESNVHAGTAVQSPAQDIQLPDDSALAIITDPPYYDAFGYSDLSDFFLAWLKRSVDETTLSQIHLNDQGMAPREQEIVVNPGATADSRGLHDRAWFESQMVQALTSCRRVAAPAAIGTIVFANKSTSGWEALLVAVVQSGWVVTGSWPIDTERPNRQRAQDSAALTSSVHLVCRPRENPDGSVREETGEWREVLAELPTRIHAWMPRLAKEGVVGADAIFACIGPALEIFSRYSRVEKASGEIVTLGEYLEQVWAAVSKEALSLLFKDADASGLEPDARLTAMWLWTLGAAADANGNGKASSKKDAAEGDEDASSGKAKTSGYVLEFDAARKIAQGLGAHLDKLSKVVEVKGDKARLLSVSERTRHLFGKDAEADQPRGRRKKKSAQMNLFEELEAAEEMAESGGWALGGMPMGKTALDRIHQAMILFAAGRGEALKRFLVEDGAGKDARFWKLAQALSALYPAGTDEKRWVDGVLGRKKGLGL